MRVLHVVESFDGQAIESWLRRVVTFASGTFPDVEWSFFCTLPRSGREDEFIRRTGAKVLRASKGVGHLPSFMHDLRKVMREGWYDVLHCHHDVMSALPLMASIGLPFRRRIVHVHNTALSLPTSNRLKIGLMREPLRQICLRTADHIVGVSRVALDAMLSGYPPNEVRDQVVHCGIDTGYANRDGAQTSVRAELGLPAEAIVLLFVGRMTPYKNPMFVIDILERLVTRDRRFSAVFAGSGPLEAQLVEVAATRGIAQNVRVLGWRDDARRLMSASDVLVWPGVEEPMEGLGLGVVEAQAAGLRVLMSRNVPEEAVIVRPLVSIVPLSDGPLAWADAAIALLDQRVPPREDARMQVKNSSFSLPRSVASLARLYGIRHSSSGNHAK